MKKIILGCFAAIILSATAISASKQQSTTTNLNSYSTVTDTVPGKMKRDTSKWHKNGMDSSMNQMTDTMRSNSRDSVPH